MPTAAAFPQLLSMASIRDSARVVRCYLAGMSVCPPYLHQSSAMEEMTGMCSQGDDESFTKKLDAEIAHRCVDQSHALPQGILYEHSVAGEAGVGELYRLGRLHLRFTSPGAGSAPERSNRIISAPSSRGFHWGFGIAFSKTSPVGTVTRNHVIA